MKVSLESTNRMIEINGVPARVWEGTTESGCRVFAAIAQVAHHKDDDPKAFEFERDLTPHKPASPRAIECWPLRMVI
ncbi:MAG: hypothetical protein E6Q97_18570 [Desulfurellales bacterium]|nr:MAG: hypothetical protein E6Q97_18570 [Desulfurellales bacterium]